MESGIYSIINTLNNKIYIGSSYNINNRYKHHINNLKRGNHHCKHLQNAYNKYGNIFQLNYIEICSKEKLMKREQHWIDFFKPEYNSVPFAITGSSKGELIYQYDLEGNFIREWKNANIASQELKISQSDIRRGVKSNKLRSSKNFVFRNYKKDKIEKYSVSGKLIYCYTLKGQFIKCFNNTIEAGIFCNCSSSHISRICRNIYGFNSANGYTFSYNQKFKGNKRKQREENEILLYNDTGYLKIFNNKKEAEKELKIPRRQLYNKNEGKYKNYYFTKI